MRRGTRVGQAYVAITGDGSGLNEDIVDSVESAGPGVEKAGEEHGERYGDSFGDASESSILDRVRGRLSRALSERMGEAGRQAGERAGSEAGDSLADRLSEKARDVGSRLGDELGQRLQSSQQAVRRGIQSAFDDDFADRIGARFGDRISESLGDRIEMALASESQNLSEMLESLVSRNRAPKGASDTDTGPSLADRLEKMLGGGSRNNFLNIFGKAIGGTVSLVEKLGSTATGVFSSFSKGMTEAGEGASFLARMSSGAGAAGSKALSGFAAAAPAAAAALLLVVGAMSVMVSVGGALLGIATALVSTIATGLVGGALVLGGAFTALAAAGGLVAVAFTSMTDAQRTMLSDAFQPIKAELTGIGQLMITQMIPYFGQWSGNLQRALLIIAPLAQRMGDVFGRAGNIITSSFSGPGFQNLIQSLTTSLPSITINMSRALGGFLNGIAGVFGAVMPLVSRFSAYLAQVADKFSNWANSAKGQNAIVDFANRAVASLQSLWGFVTQFFGFISDIIFSSAAQSAGNTIFDKLGEAFDSFRQSISNGDLERWFNDAIEFGGTLWAVMKSLGETMIALYNSGVLQAVGEGFESIANFVSALNQLLAPLIDNIGSVLPDALSIATGPLQAMAGALDLLGNKAVSLFGILGVLNGDSSMNGIGNLVSAGGFADIVNGTGGTIFGFPIPQGSGVTPIDFDLGTLINSGNNALNQTSVDHGGYLDPVKPKTPKKPEYKNPYIDFANGLIQQVPNVRQQMKAAVRQLNKAVLGAITEASTAETADAAISLLGSQFDSLKDAGNSMVSNAQSALSSSAQALANATSKKAAKAALKEVTADQRALSAALAHQDSINRAAKMVADQQVVNFANVDRLLAGFMGGNATLADYAQARAELAVKIEGANQALLDAISLRDQYNSQVADSIRSFGSILSAQASTIDGVTQALTATDITTSLQDRLDKIRAFKNNLNVLVSRGLSDDAYKQLMDAGVETGGAYVDALLAGGQGAVQQVNDLTLQIGNEASALGDQASNRLYQAGVNAAQGLIDGLNSLSGELDSAAARLGDGIAASIRRSLGIASPSRVLIADMEHVGDGAVIGLDNQHAKVGSAAARLAGQVAMTPTLAAAYAEGRVPAAVSGNGAEHHWHIETPTTDPEAVAREVLNEVTGRLS